VKKRLCHFDGSVVPSYASLSAGEFKVSGEEFEKLYGKKLLNTDEKVKRPFTLNNNFEDALFTFSGRLIFKILRKKP
jgi:hypothetical protein